MTQKNNQAEGQDVPNETNDSGLRTGEPYVGAPPPERMRTANEVGSAIVHQLNGPLTALRLYVGEIRQHSDRFLGTTGSDQALQQIVESAFQETERVCAMIRLIADTFEAPLPGETGVALGRNVIGWWSRSGDAGGSVETTSIHALLTPRELEVLNHISQGLSNKLGAIRMKIRPRTFESHRARVMRKLGAKNGADLVRMVLGENPVTP
jgi:DNA-binding CsgD family transcriptional regulator